ncbi:M20/M25/M40 family metallo-hydrolase [Microbacteriaceae bacterium 4G12]
MRVGGSRAGKRIGGAAFAAVVALLLAGCTAPGVDHMTGRPNFPAVPEAAAEPEVPGFEARTVREAFAQRNFVRHLEALQDIADEYDGNRAAGTSGYEASARYVEKQLRAAGYETERQEFDYREDRRGNRIETFSVLADTAGDPDHTIVVGGHLDSVRRGPGINDNASGVAAMLETALWLAESGVAPINRVRFAFWGGEEDGFYGSDYYVEELTDEERAATALNLNVDMVGSPNGVRSVHDGDGSDFGNGGPDGSLDIEEVFLRFFAENSLDAETTPFDDGSDYAPFLDAGIPAGGLFTGDSATKSAEQARSYGGVVGRDLDPCYHESCDTIDNVNEDLLEDMSGALAYTTAAFAMTSQE